MKDILEQLQTQAEQVDVFELHSQSTTVSFEANRLKTCQVEETQGTAVRVIRDGRLGFAAASGTDGAGRLARNALASAEFGEAIPLHFPGPQPAPEVQTYDQAIAGLPIPRLVEIGREMVDLILSYAPEARVDVKLERGLQRRSICNQAGTEISFRRSPLSAFIMVNSIRGDEILVTYSLSGATTWEEDYLAVARRMGEKVRLAQKSAALKSGRMPVLFAPTGALVLGLPLLHAFNGKNVYKGISPLAGKVGAQLFAPQITLVDDATLNGRFSSAPYDDEGVPHRRSELISQGVVQGFLYDLKTAAQAGVESSGNGARSLFSPPGPGPSNLALAPGATPLVEIIAGLEAGLLVEDVLGLGQGNIISGAFSNPVGLGFKIEQGEIVGRVKDVSIAGNVYELLKEVAAVSRETHWVYNDFCLPYMLLPEVNVVAKE